MTKTAKQILTSLDKGEYLDRGGVDQALKELEAIHQQEIAKARIDELELLKHDLTQSEEDQYWFNEGELDVSGYIERRANKLKESSNA